MEIWQAKSANKKVVAEIGEGEIGVAKFGKEEGKKGKEKEGEEEKLVLEVSIGDMFMVLNFYLLFYIYVMMNWCKT